MKKIIIIVSAAVSLSSSIAFSNDEGSCTDLAKKSADAKVAADYPTLIGSTAKVNIEAPDDDDKLPANAEKMYFSYGCSTDHPVSYLITVLEDQTSGQCTIYDVWDIGPSNYRVMCDWPEAGN